MSKLPAARRRLPENPSQEHLRKQAKRLAKSDRLPLATAQRRLADEYGHHSWAALMRAADEASGEQLRPLSAAAARADEAAVRERLSLGDPVDGSNDEAQTPLWHVCSSDAPEERRIAIARILLEAGASPRVAGEANATAIHAAAQRGPLQLVELLIRHGAFTWQADRRGKTALDYARKGTAGDRDAIVTLLDRPVIRDRRFRAAVKAIHDGDLVSLNRLLDEHPQLLRERAIEPDCYPRDYFRDPKLFWFIANNPTLMKRMPANIAEIGRAMTARGIEQSDLDCTLELVISNGQDDHQADLVAMLMEAGARASPRAILVALAHRCIEPIRVLLDRGLTVTAPVAAGLGRNKELSVLLGTASQQDRQDALGMAVINKHIEAARLCLDAGADPNAFLPIHQHSTPLHQAAVDDDVGLAKLLVARGAASDTRDTLWNATPLDWAVHNGKRNTEAYLRSLVK